MSAILLDDTQITRIGKFPAPLVAGFNSLFFHPLTMGETTVTYKKNGDLN